MFSAPIDSSERAAAAIPVPCSLFPNPYSLASPERVPLKTNAQADAMNYSQMVLAKDAGCLAGSQDFCKAKMAEIQPPDGDERF